LADAADPQPSPGAAHTGQDESYRVEPRG
jgi:hypothetical protein